MNARTTTLLIVLALTLAACVAPMPAPPVKMPAQPKTEQALPLQSEPAQNKLPATNMTQPADEQAAALLAVQQQLVSQLMVGVPLQARDYIEAYAAIEVARQQKPATKPDAVTTYPDIVRGALEGSVTTMPYALPEQKATVPKSREVQELDDMLKPATMPEDMLAAKIAVIRHWAVGTPPEVQPAIERYIEELTLPASTIPVRDQWYLETQDETARETVLQSYEDTLSPEAIMGSTNLPASQMLVRDQWYLEE